MLPETIERLKKLYDEKKDIVDYMEKFGNDFEKAQANVIKSVALGTFEA